MTGRLRVCWSAATFIASVHRKCHYINTLVGCGCFLGGEVYTHVCHCVYSAVLVFCVKYINTHVCHNVY